MIECAPALHHQTQATMFPVHRRQIAEHKPTTFDIGRLSGRDGIHPDREKGIPLRSDEPPSAIASLGSEKPGRAKGETALEPAKAVAFRGLGTPLRELPCLFFTPLAKHLDRADLLGPGARAILAETIDNPVICGFVCLARRLDAQR